MSRLWDGCILLRCLGIGRLYRLRVSFRTRQNWLEILHGQRGLGCCAGLPHTNIVRWLT